MKARLGAGDGKEIPASDKQLAEMVESLVWVALALLFLFATLAGFMGSRSHRDHMLADAYEKYGAGTSFFNAGIVAEIRGNPLWRFAGPVIAACCLFATYYLRSVIPYRVLVMPVVVQFFAALYAASTIRDGDDDRRVNRNVGVADAPVEQHVE